ncbi:MAG: polymer-forming cytoskeletal protein, partial [Eubacteriaceae bacterium]|nr:polymer-forming cytoskeletal protein [Eubacteriaceae bacterium]
MKKKTTVIAILIVLLLASVPVYAAGASSQATNVAIEAGQTNNSDIIGVLNYLDIKGTQQGNVFAFTSKSASVTGIVDGLFANASNASTLAGEFTKDVFAYATIMEINNAEFNDDLYVISGYSLASNEGCEFNDNVYIYCAESVVLRGHIKGDVVIKAASVTIDGQIDKNATIYSDNIQISQNAKISGNLNYYSSLNASVDASAVIGGKINQTKLPAKADSSGLSVLSVGIAIFRILFIVLLAWVLS